MKRRVPQDFHEWTVVGRLPTGTKVLDIQFTATTVVIATDQGVYRISGHPLKLEKV